MTEVTGVSSASQTVSNNRATSAPPTIEYDAFLKLLVTQLENQDPLEPMSETEYVAQLASFSNVEQNTKTNERLDALMTQMALSQAADLVGKPLRSPTGESGIVESVRVIDGGAVATLVDGSQVAIGAGVTVGG